MKYTKKDKEKKSELLSVYAGKVKEAKNDSFILDVEYWDTNGRVNTELDLPYANANTLTKGHNVTAVVSPGRVDAVMKGQAYFEKGEVGVITGFVERCFMNEEKNTDGTAKLTKDGKEKKPHFDIIVKVDDVSHRIKIYNGKFEPDAIEKAKKEYGNLGEERTENDVTTRKSIVGTFITSAGTAWESTKDGKVYKNCDHTGLVKADTREVMREVTKQQEAQAEAKAEAVEQSSGDGFMNIADDLDEELPFN